MHKYEELMAEHCDGKPWDELPIQAQTEIIAQYLRDEGFDACVAGIREPQFMAVFTHRLADMIEARYFAPDEFARAGRSFAAGACALLMHEIGEFVRQEYEDVLADHQSDHPEDVDGPAEAQARYNDFVGMVRQ